MLPKLATLLVVLAGVGNLLPVVGVLSAERLHALYGVTIEDPDLLVLMRHRAVLFGIVGGLLLAAAFHPPLRAIGIGAGLLSMLSFVLVVVAVGEVGPELRRLLWLDVGLSAGLLVALAIDRLAGTA